MVAAGPEMVKKEGYWKIIKQRFKQGKSVVSCQKVDGYIHFYNYERTQSKNGVAPLTLRHSA